MLSLALPCRDQADHIARVLGLYANALADVEHELLVVPNGCTDGTEAVLASVARETSRVRVVPCAGTGWGRAVRTGLATARGDIVAFTNSARTQPTTLREVLDVYRAHAPCLAKARRLRRGAPLRSAGSALYNAEARFLYGLSVGDVNGTPKVLSRELWERLAPAADGDLLDLELVVKATRLGIPIVELPAEGFARFGGRSRTRLGSAWRMYAGAVRLRSSLRRWRPA
jgi:glycosyltransferase involved in cell wall biosynthesis